MSRGWIVNLLLLVFLTACGLGLWLADRKEAENKTREERSRVVSGLTAEKVTKATLQAKGEAAVTLEKKGDKWQITAPGPMLTDQESVTRLLAILERSYKQHITDKPEQPADFGLAEPEAILTVHPAQGEPTILQLGSQSPTSANRYLRLGTNGPVVMIPAHDVSGLSMKPQDLRPKKLGIALDDQPLKEIDLTHKDGREMVLQQDESGQWQGSKPLADRLSNTLTQTWLDGLRRTLAVNFVAGSAPEKPDWTLTMKPVKGDPLTLVVWRGEGSLLAKRPGDPDLMVLDATATNLLDKSLLALVDLRPLPPGVEMQRLTLDRGNQHLEAERKTKTETKVPESDKKPAPKKNKEEDWPSPIWQSIEEVLLRDAKEAESLAPLDPPDFTVTVDNKGTPLRFPFKKIADSYRMAPPNRPVLLRLTPMQSTVLDETLKIMFADKADKEIKDPAPKAP
ncbi:MAG: DUF4340 domain-containing protein [Magnetococcales bacterium]|nr:DUF4340 domain-containing protein [Magnetococcales bacterium]